MAVLNRPVAPEPLKHRLQPDASHQWSGTPPKRATERGGQRGRTLSATQRWTCCNATALTPDVNIQHITACEGYTTVGAGGGGAGRASDVAALPADGGAHRLLATRKEPREPLCWPTVSISPSVASRGTNTLTGPHRNNLQCRAPTLCPRRSPAALQERKQRCGLDFTRPAGHGQPLPFLRWGRGNVAPEEGAALPAVGGVAHEAPCQGWEYTCAT